MLVASTQNFRSQFCYNRGGRSITEQSLILSKETFCRQLLRSRHGKDIRRDRTNNERNDNYSGTGVRDMENKKLARNTLCRKKLITLLPPIR